ncbi:hypothetical protein GGC47_001052 [Bosea sp. OAE752]|uniref:hypothetical protein n=1 Tax=Bosea sp. OAE752 TaxID=2663873 RepID=UPI003D1A1953
MPPFPFQMVKRIDAGAGNPIVARLGMQTADLLKWIDISEEKRGDIAQLYIFNLCEKMVYCERIIERIERLRKEAGDASAANPAIAPFIPELEPICHDFLYQTKNLIRDALLVFDPLFGKRFKDASDLVDLKRKGNAKVVDWAIKALGPNHSLTEMLTNEATWVSEPIKMRNAVEHPGGFSGTLQILNVRRMAVIGGPLVGPVWRRREGGYSDVLSDMRAMLVSILTFAEELIVQAVMALPASKQIQVYEVPEAERDPQAPIRFKVAPNEEILALIAAHQAREK